MDYLENFWVDTVYPVSPDTMPLITTFSWKPTVVIAVLVLERDNLLDTKFISQSYLIYVDIQVN